MTLRTHRMEHYFMFLSLLLLSVASFNQGLRIIEPEEEVVNVREGTHVEIHCQSDASIDVQWKFAGMRLGREPGVTISVINMGSEKTSVLRLEAVTPENGGVYQCTDPEDLLGEPPSTKLIILADDGARAVEIVEPVEEEIRVSVGQDLLLRCIAAVDDQVIWKHNGMPLEQSARVIITAAIELDQQISTSLLTRTSITEAEAGTYLCQDADEFFNKDSTVVHVSSEAGSASVDINLPRGLSLRVRPGETIRLRCVGDASTSSLSWMKDNQLVSSTELGASYEITAVEDVQSGEKTSMLSLDEAPEEASGVYSCQDSGNTANMDEVAVTVAESDSAPTGSRASIWMTAPLLLLSLVFITQ